MTREETQLAWEKIVDKGYSNYGQLTREQRVWFNIEPLITHGIIDHYVNYGAEHNQETIDDLELLGFSNIANLLRQMNLLFKNGEPPIDIDERNEEIISWNEKTEKLLDELDDKFWNECDDLEKVLFNYINKTGIGRE